jgi:hypothetical protein
MASESASTMLVLELVKYYHQHVRKHMKMVNRIVNRRGMQQIEIRPCLQRYKEHLDATTQNDLQADCLAWLHLIYFSIGEHLGISDPFFNEFGSMISDILLLLLIIGEGTTHNDSANLLLDETTVEESPHAFLYSLWASLWNVASQPEAITVRTLRKSEYIESGGTGNTSTCIQAIFKSDAQSREGKPTK